MGTGPGSVYTFRPHPGREEVWSQGVGLFGNEYLNASDLKLRTIKAINFTPFRGREHGGGFRRMVFMSGSISGGAGSIGNLNNQVRVLTGQVRGSAVPLGYPGSIYIGTVGSLSASFFARGA